MLGVPEGGQRRCADTGSPRVFATARVEARPPVSSSPAADAATAPTAAAAAAESAVKSLHRSLCQFGNERIQFILGTQPTPLFLSSLFAPLVHHRAHSRTGHSQA